MRIRNTDCGIIIFYSDQQKQKQKIRVCPSSKTFKFKIGTVLGGTKEFTGILTPEYRNFR
jgi:hypothetical protein